MADQSAGYGYLTGQYQKGSSLNPARDTYLRRSVQQSNCHFHALSARVDDVVGHLKFIFFIVDLTEHPLIEADEVFLLKVIGSFVEFLEIMKVQRVVSVVGQIPRHRVA